MRLTQRLLYMAAGAALVVGAQVVVNNGVPAVYADSHTTSGRGAIKYLLTVDYPLGGKTDYIEWVKAAGQTLQAQPEVMGMASYDNYYGASPNRVIEVEFGSTTDAAAYFDRAEIRAIMEDWSNHGVNAAVHVLALRSDYTK